MIGRTTAPVGAGELLHLHNLSSNYLAAHLVGGAERGRSGRLPRLAGAGGVAVVRRDACRQASAVGTGRLYRNGRRYRDGRRYRGGRCADGAPGRAGRPW